MSSPWASAEELREDVTALLDRFAATPEGEAAATVARGLADGLTIELDLRDPDLVLALDLANGTTAEGPAATAAVRVALPAADMHDLLLDRLGPIEISRLVEEQRLHLTGAPSALCAAVVGVAQLQPHYEASLRERGREHLLDTPRPVVGAVWESAAKPAPVFGVRRPWQAPKGARAEA
jgi:hypothetical protein